MREINKIYIGIDGGLSGGITVLKDSKIVEMIAMPIHSSTKGRNEYDCQKIIELLKNYDNSTVILEKAQYTPKLGGTASFSFGKSYGMMIGMLTALKIRYHIVAARTWQREIFRDINYKDTKHASILIATRLFPDVSFLATKKSKKHHNGLTDSCLIACWAERNNI